MGRNKKKPEVIEVEAIGRTWEYSPEPRLEGLLQASKYLKWKNIIDKDNNIFKKRLKEENRFNKNRFKQGEK